ncbi:hypothetical protein ASV02_08035 [Enterobacter hormaechei subsp. xiangfangensis]|nr:hypothetical protein ASV32_25000 [Enterobacter hormaechei subsp. xiangfangensis]KTH49666.1 hypothetical protein ASV24_11440 [Enterobacter hormaechei subsp. xiangfangensis]KTI58058.1 hypothetical protein ASV02_08035 [Enterobacter hormaechei subsp. xiangfangensis]KVI96252.1 hypothetical protein AWS44_18160 [Enterobacter hormaechei subsp. xiangfangensis]KVJ15049.1 hypothetical protein AWS39_06990 [Enterobacter hormaechei subsp. xiangfangensis]
MHPSFLFNCYVDEIDCIANKIQDELNRGIIRPQTRDTFNVVMKRMYQDEDIEAIILVCTKLPVLFAGTEAPDKALDTVYILIVTSFEPLN